MDLTPEDDDLLSYFLSADVAAERMPAPPASAGAPNESFAVSQSAPLPHERAFGASAQSAGSAGGAGPVSAFQQMQNAFGASESSGPRSTTTEDDNAAGGPGDTDEKRQRRCVLLRSPPPCSLLCRKTLMSSLTTCRLARNRESARQSRRRKKQYLELLEEKVSERPATSGDCVTD